MTDEERKAMFRVAWEASSKATRGEVAEIIAAIEPIIRKDEARECAEHARNFIGVNHDDFCRLADALEARHP